VPLETARSGHRFAVASMTSRRAGRMWAELAGIRSTGSGCRMRPGCEHSLRTLLSLLFLMRMNYVVGSCLAVARGHRDALNRP
jgi:hypothetical protein